MLEIATVIVILFCVSGARRAARATRRVAKRLSRAVGAAVTQGARLRLAASVPPGGIILVVHGDGETWFVAKPTRPPQESQGRNR